MEARAICGGRIGIVAVVFVALAAGLVVQWVGCNQTAHLALVKSLADGTPRIDRYEAETCDDSYVNGHYYAAKAPGLALVTLPWYLVLRATGLDTPNQALGLGYPSALAEMPRSAVWQVGLWGTTLWAFALLLMMRWAAGRLVPGYGTVTAVTLGLATLVLPFSTVFFAHALSTCLVFAAFCVLLAERGGPERLLLVAGAGLLAGLATTVEFPVGIIAAGLLAYALAGRVRVGRLLAYGAGGFAGLMPLLAFDVWALGSPFELSYTNAVIDPGESGHDVIGANASGFFGVGMPSLRAGVELLLSGKGLLVLAPVVFAGILGLVPLWRSGRKAEASLAGGVTGCFLVYNAAYWLPFGGWVPGPRFLVPTLPFIALGLAAAYRVRPVTTLALAGISAAWMTAATVTNPLIAGDEPGVWLTRIRAGDFADTVVTLLGGGHGWLAITPVLALIAAAAVIAVAGLPVGWLTRDELLPASVAVVGWVVIGLTTPELLRADRFTGGLEGLAATLLLTVGVALTVVASFRRERRAFIGLPLLLVALPLVDGHTRWVLVLVTAVDLAFLAEARVRRAPTIRTT